jgi:hypothetical protein
LAAPVGGFDALGHIRVVTHLGFKAPALTGRAFNFRRPCR